MKIEDHYLPSKANPHTITIRFHAEDAKEDKQIKTLSDKLKGTNVLVTTPTIKDRICLSLIFSAHSKRAGSK